jgi:hypothetical protein
MMDVCMREPESGDWVVWIDGWPIGGFPTEEVARNFRDMIRGSNLVPHVYPDGELVWRDRPTDTELNTKGTASG